MTNLKESPALLAADAAEAARARLRRDRDDGRRRPLRAAERDLAPGRLADGPARRDDAVRGRGAAQPRAGDPRPRHVRRDALGLRHRAGLRRRRRHALVEGVPRRRLRLARRQGALHLGHGLRGADGPRAGPLDALPRGALPRRGARGRLAGRPERLDLVRRARALGAGRHAGDPRRERPRRLARPRGRVRQRRDRLALGDPQDGEADGPVPARHRLRHVRLLGDAAPRQHVRRRQLRRRRPRRVAHDPARLAGRRGHRAGRRGRGAARARAAARAVQAVFAELGLPPVSDAEVEAATVGYDSTEMPDRDRAADVEAADELLARGVSRARRRARARPARVRRRRGGGRLDAAAADLGRLPADGGGDRRRRPRPLGGERPERLQRARAPATGSRASAGSCCSRCRTSSIPADLLGGDDRRGAGRPRARRGGEGRRSGRGRRRGRAGVRRRDQADDRRPEPPRRARGGLRRGSASGGAEPRLVRDPPRSPTSPSSPTTARSSPARGSRSGSSRRARR